MTNPFKYGREVSGYQFYDRKEAGELLYRRLSGGSTDVVMYAPRRYGKTSLVLRVLERFRQEGVSGLCFDMAKVPSLERFCEEYANSVFALIGGRRELMHKVMDYLAHLHPTLSVNGEISLNYGTKMTPTSISEVLDLPERLAEDAGLDSVIVAFDEFQEIAELSQAFPLEKIFRSCIQAHRRVRYVFFGSKTHLLKRMFADHSRPFYESAQPMRLEKPPRDESIEFLVSHFADAGISLTVEAANVMVTAAENIPYYVQAVASTTFDRAVLAQRNAVTPEDIDGALEDLVRGNGDLYSERLRGLSRSQNTLLLALAKEPAEVFDDAYRLRHGLPVSSTLHSALTELVNEGLAEVEDGIHKCADPFLVRYLLMPSARVFVG